MMIPILTLALAGAPPAPIPSAQKMFRQVQQLIEKEYVDREVSDDALWTSATQGVLERLVQADGERINTLLSPAELAELQGRISGSISGVGIVIRDVEGMVMVREVIPGGPAEGAGIAAGDRILSVAGKSVRGMAEAEILGAIRGA